MRRLLISTVVMVMTALSPAAAAAVVHPADAGDTSVSSQFASVSCPTSKECVAVGATERDTTNSSGQIVSGSVTPIAARSTDGGRTWSTIALPSSPDTEANAIDCPTAKHCELVGAGEYLSDGSWDQAGGMAMASTDRGASWHLVSLPASTRALNATACATGKVCVAVGGQHKVGTLDLLPVVLRSTDAGGKWSRASMPTGHGYYDSVACPTTKECAASGVTVRDSGSTFANHPIALRSTDGGRKWRTARIAGKSGTGGPQTMACATSKRCIALGDVFQWCECGTGTPGHYAEIWTTHNGGKSWSRHVLPTIAHRDVWDLDAATCWSANGCYAAGDGTKPTSVASYYPLLLGVSKSNAWRGPGTHAKLTQRLRAQWIYGLTCRSSRSCIAVGQNYQNTIAIETSHKGKWTSRHIG